MLTNATKSCCLRIGPRHNIECSNITTASGHIIPRVDTMRYLGIYITRSVKFKCSLSNAKKGFYRSVNVIFGKVGRIASEEVVLHLVTTKCIPVLLYGVEVCPLTNAEMHSLDFAVTRFRMKLFKISSITVKKTAADASVLTAKRTS